MKASHCCLAVLTLTTSFPQSLQADELRGRGDPQAMPRSIVMRRRRTSVCRSVTPPPNPFSFCPRHSLGCFAVVHKHHLHLSWATRCINQFDEDVKAFSLHLIMNWFIVLALCLMELSPWQWFTRHWHQPLHLSNTPSYSLPLFLCLSPFSISPLLPTPLCSMFPHESLMTCWQTGETLLPLHCICLWLSGSPVLSDTSRWKAWQERQRLWPLPQCKLCSSTDFLLEAVVAELWIPLRTGIHTDRDLWISPTGSPGSTENFWWSHEISVIQPSTWWPPDFHAEGQVLFPSSTNEETEWCTEGLHFGKVELIFLSCTRY